MAERAPERTVPTGTNPALALTALLVAVASFQMNATMLSPAIGDMATSLGTDTSTIGLSATVFLFVAGLAGIVLPRYSDLVGRRRVLFASIAVMATGSLIATLALNVPMLMVGRALQGACGATIALGILTLRDILPAQRFGRYLGILTAVNSGVAGLDTLLAGVMADSLGFRSIFGLTFVLEVVAVVMIARWVPDTARSRDTPMDWGGAAVICAALLALNAYLTFGPTSGWTSVTSWLLLAAGILMAVAFWAVERNQSHPLLPVHTLARRGVWGLLLTTFATMASVFALLTFVVPAMAQDMFGFNATTTALMFTAPYALLGWILAPVAGHLAPKVGYRRVLRVGLVGNLVLIAGTAFTTDSPWLTFVLVALMGVSYAACMATASNGLGVIYAPPESPGMLPGLNATMFNLGASVGTGVLSAVIAKGAGGGFAQALTVAAVISAVAVVASFALPGRAGHGERV